VNVCLDCNSLYDRPGTCNCFAPGGKRGPRVIIDVGAPGEWSPAKDAGWNKALRESMRSLAAHGAVMRKEV